MMLFALGQPPAIQLLPPAAIAQRAHSIPASHLPDRAMGAPC
jgi:hypothetical protein